MLQVARSLASRLVRRNPSARALLAILLLGFLGRTALAGPQKKEVPLVVGNRTIHVFREALGDFSAEERAEAAREHIASALDLDGDGWTSILPARGGVIVALDGKPMFTVTPGDAREAADETPESLANQASRVLQKVWSERRESRDSKQTLAAAIRVALAFAVLLVVLKALTSLVRAVRNHIARRFSDKLDALVRKTVGSHVSESFFKFAGRAGVVLMWVLGLGAVFAFLSYSLGQFVLTRPISENLVRSLESSLYDGLRSSAAALPGIFFAILIFLLARIATQVSQGMFERFASGRIRMGALDAHTAPATRYLVNASIWLFALAMSYPYLPGSHTEAFKGLSVLLGVMVSIGASGLVGQIASGMILVFTRSLKAGEYVRIQDCEGTVTQLGLFVTRLKTGIGEEIALPNFLVVSHVTRNYSRNAGEGGYVLDTTITLGYDTPWRQAHALLLEAAGRIPELRKDPAPYVIQSALGDFSVAYRLVVQVNARAGLARPRILSDLNAAIQDVFNQYGVQIMSPHYVADPQAPKVVPEDRWHEAPASPAPKG